MPGTDAAPEIQVEKLEELDVLVLRGKKADLGVVQDKIRGIEKRDAKLRLGDGKDLALMPAAKPAEEKPMAAAFPLGDRDADAFGRPMAPAGALGMAPGGFGGIGAMGKRAAGMELFYRRNWYDLSKANPEQLKELERYRFAVRQYAHEHVAGEPGVRSDFAETLYWNPLLIAGADGKTPLSFDLSDSVTTFRLMADAHGGGRIGSGWADIVSASPSTSNRNCRWRSTPATASICRWPW